MSQDIILRPFEEEDRPYLRCICYATSFPSWKKSSRKVATVPLMFLSYFLDYQKDLAFVAVCDGAPIGYIIGTTEAYPVYKAIMKKRYYPKMRKSYLFSALYFDAFLHYHKMDRDTEAHLHINILKGFRGEGIGSALLDCLKAALAKKGIHSVDVICADRKAESYSFYEKKGFRIHQRFGGKIANLRLEF
jgi:ribosomal protein S18 acetylase RimI-like enzyme